MKKPSLKAIAATPVIPALNIGSKEGTPSKAPAQTESADVYWLGAKLHDLKGEEFSAYGTRKEDGGVALAEVPKTSEAARCGLRENDLVQAVNGRQVSNTGQLFKTLAEIGDAPLKVSVVRNQQVTVLAVSSEYIHRGRNVGHRRRIHARLPLPSSPCRQGDGKSKHGKSALGYAGRRPAHPRLWARIQKRNTLWCLQTGSR